MGIKGLKPFLKKEGVNCFYLVKVLSFHGSRWAIDGLNWVFCYANNVVKNILHSRSDITTPISQEEMYKGIIKEFLQFSNKLMENGITPVWVWDGVSKDNKGVTKVERRNARKVMIEKKENITTALKDLNPLERPGELLQELRKLIINTAYVSREKIEELKQFSMELGIPTVIAEDEAETLCSSLGVERRVSATWSADTDTLPLGAPLVVKGFEWVQGELYINCIFTLNILRDLKFNHKEFRDFCILLGTDFNDNLPQIGPAKSFKLINKFRCLEMVEKETQHNCYQLNFRQVREQLSSKETSWLKDEEINVRKNLDHQALEEKYKMWDLKQTFINIRNLDNPKNVEKN